MKQLLKRAWNSMWDMVGYELAPTRVHPESIDANGRMRLAPLRGSMAQALRHLKSLGFTPTTVIDVGAGHGTDDLLHVFPDAYHFWIEPLKEFVPFLEKLRTRYKGEYHIAAAGPEKGRITIHVHPFAYGSSVLPESDGAVADGEPREVDLIALDGLVAGRDLGSAILLKVDVQGFELHVLNGARDLLPKCDAVILEVSFFRFHHSEPEFIEVLQYMKDRGFVVYDLFDGHNRPLDNALAQRDVLFVQEPGRFRKTHQWASAEQRKRLAQYY